MPTSISVICFTEEECGNSSQISWRQVFEDAAGFIVRGVLMNRNEGDKDVAVRETKSLQELFGNIV